MAPTLRRPYDDDADDCARLLYISAPNVYSYSLTEHQSKLYELLRLFFGVAPFSWTGLRYATDLSLVS